MGGAVSIRNTWDREGCSVIKGKVGREVLGKEMTGERRGEKGKKWREMERDGKEREREGREICRKGEREEIVQLPSRLSYTSGINNRQGQSFDKVSMCLPESVFSHW